MGLPRPESGPREHLAFAAPERHRLSAAGFMVGDGLDLVLF